MSEKRHWRRQGPITANDYAVEDRGYETPCWIWTQAIGTHGYALVRYGAKQRDAHRVSYMQFVGEIPEGLLLHHRCFQRPCIRPDHLQLTTVNEHASLHRPPPTPEQLKEGAQSLARLEALRERLDALSH